MLQVFFLSFSDFAPASHHSTKAQYLSVSTIDVSDGPNQAVDYYLCVVLPFIMAQWLRCCATNQKVTGSIPDGVIGIFH